MDACKRSWQRHIFRFQQSGLYVHGALYSDIRKHNSHHKGCITNLTTAPVCQTVTVDLLAVTVTIDPPNPQVLFADGVSQSNLYANLTNAPQGAAVTWVASPGTASKTGPTTGTYTSPLASSVTGAIGFSPTANTASASISACYGTPQICSTPSPATNITLVQPVSITGGVPTSLTAGSTTTITITGAGFGTNPTVTVNNSNGGYFSNITWTQGSATNTPNTSIQGSIFVPLNLENVGTTQPFTLTVTSTTDGLTSSATSASINILPAAYTYTIALQVANPSLTYGYSTLITPVMTCKTSTGTTCSSTVFNPQTALASFSLTQNAVYGSLSSATGSNQSPPSFTIAQLGGYPSPTVVVQGCVTVPVPAPVCSTANISIPVTSITLNPSTVNNVLVGGSTQSFSANIQNEGIATSLTWTLSPSPGNAAPGAMASPTTSITVQGTPTSGISGPNVYSAPASITTPTTVTLKACMTANQSICATPVAITLQPPPTINVTATLTSSQTALSMGHTMTYSISVLPLYGFTGPVALTISGLPTGVSGIFSSNSINTSGIVTLTLSAAYSVTTFIGQSTLTVTGTSGSLSVPAVIQLTTRPLQYRGDCGVQ